MSSKTFPESAHINGIHYITAGAGPPVVLLHGMAASLHDWARLLPDLAQAGYQAYAPDLPGHGDSDKPEDPDQYHVDIIMARLVRWIESLQLEQPLQLVGHSLGGYLSLAYANRYPDRVASLVLIDPFYTPDQLSTVLRVARRKPSLGAKTMRVVPEWLINTILGWDPSSAAEFSPQARQQIANDYKRASPHFVYITKDIPDLTPILREIMHPVSVIWGEQDMTLSPQSFPKLVQALPEAIANPIVGCGHQPHIGSPKVVNELVLEFLNGIGEYDSPNPYR